MNNKIEFTETVKVEEVEKVEEKKDKKAIILLLLLLLLLFMISMSIIIFKSKKPTATLGEKYENPDYIGTTPTPEVEESPEVETTPKIEKTPEPMPELPSSEGKIKIVSNTTKWTNKEVIISVEYISSDENIKKLISIDNGKTFEEYTEPVKVFNNTKIIAKLETNEGKTIAAETLDIQNIDKLEPKQFNITVVSNKRTITIKTDADDADETEESGKSGIKEYKYIIKNSVWERAITSKENTYEFNMLKQGEKYIVQVYAIDNAGNEKASEEIEVEIKFQSTLTINPNGGIWEGSEAVQNIVQDRGTTKQITPPTRSGYTFKKWIKKDGGELENNIYTYNETNETIVAEWEINQYTLNFDANGGVVTQDTMTQDYSTSIVLPTPTMSNYTVSYDTDGGDAIENSNVQYTFDGWYTEAVGGEKREYTKMPAVDETLYAHWNNTSAKIILPTSTKTGYTLEGWYEDSLLTTKIGNVGDYYIPTGDVTIYAKWQINKYTITFNANEGLVTPNIIKEEYNTSINLPTPKREYELTIDDGYNIGVEDTKKVNYTFDGWYTEAVGGEKREYTKMPAVDETLYAHWNNTSAKIILPTPTKIGYTFVGWYKDSNLTIKIGNAGEEYILSSNETIYAKWQVNQYTLNFDANEGVVSPDGINGDYNTIITLPVPTRKYEVVFNTSGGDTIKSSTSAYNFTGWYTDKVAGEERKYTKMPAGDETLYAHWDDTSAKITLPTPTKAGYTFIGWYEDNTYANKIGNAGDEYLPTSDITLYASWQVNEYTLTFDGNGGDVTPDKITEDYSTNITLPAPTRKYEVIFNTDGGDAVPNETATYTFEGWYTDKVAGDKREYTNMPAGDETLYAHWDNTSAKITLPTPTKAGYIFIGWYEDNTYTNKIGNAGDEYLPTSDVTIYAKWQTNEYTLTFDGNGGDVTPDKITEEYGKDITLPTPTKEYTVSFDTDGGDAIPNETATYTFEGWYTDKVAGDKREYTKMPEGDETLYAHWDNTSAKITLPTPTKAGHTFTGWYEDNTYINKIGNAGEDYIPTSNVTIYAKWQVNQYTLTFDGNDGDVTPDKITEDYGKDITLPTPTKEYTVSFDTDGGNAVPNETATYTFEGWYTDKVAGDKREYTKMPEGDETLYAHWDNASAKITLPTPTKAGHTFAGWYEDNTYINKIGNAGEDYIPTSNVTIYAKWQVNQYTLTFDGNDGDVTPDKITEEYGKDITLPTPTKEYTVSFDTDGGNAVPDKTATYTFEGWYTDKVAGDKREYTKMPEGDETLYAHWDNASAKITLPTPTKAGHTFGGWYEDSSLTIKIGDAGDEYITTKDETLYASWKINPYILTFDAMGGTIGSTTITEEYGKDITLPTPTKEYTVSFDTDGGDAIPNETVTYTFVGWYTDKVAGDKREYTKMPAINETLYAHWDNASAKIILPTPTKEGYTFIGWYEDNTYTNKIGNAGDEYIPTSNVTICAKWQVNQYTLTFDGNGITVTPSIISQNYDTNITLPTPVKEYTVSFDTDGGNAISNETLTYTFEGWYTELTAGDKRTYTKMPAVDETLYAHWDNTSAKITLPTPTKTGYTLEGWYADSSLTTKIGNAGDEYIPTSDVTLYAKWEINQYTLTLDGNGITITPNTISQDYNTDITMPIPIREYTVNFHTDASTTLTDVTIAYTFEGWYTDKVAGDKREYTKMPAGDETLYAHWDNTSAKVILPSLTETGYTFNGWYADSSLTTKIGDAGDEYLPTNDVTLYASWQVNQYTLTFDGNGGDVTLNKITEDYGETIILPTSVKEYTVNFDTDGGNAISNETVTYTFVGWYTDKIAGDKREYTKMPAGDETLYAHWDNTSAKITLPTPTKIGYTFNGWYADSNLATKIGNAGDEYIPTSDVTLYAKWKINQYTLTFDGNGITITPNTISQDYGTNITLPTPVREYTVSFDTDGGDAISDATTMCIFSGWYTDRVAGDKREYTKMPAGDETLYAHWDNTSAKITLPTPTKVGYTFLGWYEDNTYTNKIGDAGDYYTPTNNITLYANWQINEYTLTLDGNGGAVAPNTITADYDTNITLPTPTRTHTVNFNTDGGNEITSETVTYTFEGWYTETVAGEERTYTAMPAGDETLYAHWNNAGTKITLKEPTKVGHTFDGWYTDDTYTTKVGDVGDSYIPITDITLCAKWQVNQYTLTFDANGGTLSQTSITSDFDANIYLPSPTINGYTIAFNTNGGDTIQNKTVSRVFKGWYTDPVGGEKREYTNMPAVNETLYAHWEDANYKLPTPTKTGYAFGAWYEDSACTILAGRANEVYVPIKDVTLYAKWAVVYAKLYDDGTLALSSTDVTLPGKTLYHDYGNRAAGGNLGDYNRITTVEIVDKISPISTENWFENCYKLTTINNIGNLDTSNVIDMSRMFIGCTSLTSLDLSSFNTSNVTDMSDMFANCRGLTSLDLSSFNTSKVTSMNNMFSGCSGLTSLDLSSFNTSNNTDMYRMFYGCSNLASIVFSNKLKTMKSYRMDQMFYNCSKLTSIDLSSFDTSNVTYMSSMFSGCRGLTRIDLTPLDTSNVTHMSSMFSGCSGLTSIDLTPLDTSNATNMGGMFSGCSGLTSIDLSPLDTSNVTYMSSMFSGCRGLTRIDLTPLDTSNVTHMSSMFSGCSGLTSIDLTPLDTSNVTNMSYMFSWCSGLTSIDLTPLDTSNVTDMSYMFANNQNLTINLDQLDTTKLTDVNHMFYSTNNLTVDLSKLNTSNATDMSYMFASTSGLTNIDFSGFNTSSATNMSYMFTSCRDSSLNLTNFNTANVTDMSYMFNRCNSLISITFGSNFTAINTTNMSYMFSECSALTSLDLSKFKTTNVTNMKYMFNKCSGLTSITFSSNFKTTNVTDMSYMFNECSSLPRITLTYFTTANVTNMSNMFNGCSGLTSITVTKFDTSKVTDMDYMFSNCTGLTSLNLTSFDTSSLGSSGEWNAYKRMVFGCSNLTTVSVSSTKWTIGSSLTINTGKYVYVTEK